MSLTLVDKYPPSHVLYQLAQSIARSHDDLRVELPSNLRYHPALKAVDECLGDANDLFHLLPRRSPKIQAILREMALENVQSWKSESSKPTLPIRTQGLLKDAGLPKPLSANSRARLRENFQPKPSSSNESNDPYVLTLRAKLAQGKLPTISANVIISGIDDEKDKSPNQMMYGADILWDTGAPHTVITREFLSEDLQKYLALSIHDPYRTEDGSRVQVDFIMEFTNCLLQISTVAVVVDKMAIPNQRVGIIFGQHGGIDRISFHSIPRSLLQAKGVDIDDSFWGDIVLEEYLTVDDEILDFGKASSVD